MLRGRMKFAWLILLAGCVRSNPTWTACDGGACVCTPRTCADLAGGCGAFPDGCGGTVVCGCPSGQHCSNVRCVNDNGCTPRTCADFAGSCGSFSDGCNSTISCGCPSGQSCSGGVCKTPNGCTPETCADFAGFCGAFADGCNGTLSCGCPSGDVCTSAGECCTPLGCALGDCGMLSDGCGNTIDCGPCPVSPWKAIGSFSAEMRRVFATPAAGVWIADFTGTVYHTADDSSFATQKVQSQLSELFILDGDVWVGGADGISHKGPLDAGFTLSPTGPKNTGGLHGVPGSLFATTANTTGDVAHSSDGTTWTSIAPSPSPASLFAVFAPSSTEAFAVGHTGSIYHTTDASHWVKQTSNVTVELPAIWGSGSLLVVTGLGGTILRSTNQGTTWTKATSGTTNDLYGVWGRSTTDIWVSGQNATVLHSTDGGVTWTQETGLPISTGILFSIFETDTGKVYAVGQNGAILVRSP
jgi:Photosynthesis system II assembly factor YCF48